MTRGRAIAALILLLSLGTFGRPLALAQGSKKAGFFQEVGFSFFGQESFGLNEPLPGLGGVLHMAGPLTLSRNWRLDFRLEAVATFWRGYDHAMEVGLVPALRLYYGTGKTKPYLEVGLGFTLNSLNIAELSTAFQFLSFAGVGFRRPVSPNASLDLAYRIRHISNNGLKEPNLGADHHQVQLGIVVKW